MDKLTKDLMFSSKSDMWSTPAPFPSMVVVFRPYNSV